MSANDLKLRIYCFESLFYSLKDSRGSMNIDLFSTFDILLIDFFEILPLVLYNFYRYLIVVFKLIVNMLVIWI